MGTVATATKIAGVSCIGPEMYMGIFELTMDTTDNAGNQTIDLTSHFDYIHSIMGGGSDAPTGYVLQYGIPATTTAITSSNVKVGIYEAGDDGDPLDFMDQQNAVAMVPGAIIVVIGRQSI